MIARTSRIRARRRRIWPTISTVSRFGCIGVRRLSLPENSLGVGIDSTVATPVGTNLQAERVNPYLGPQPFKRADAYRVFGRENEASDLSSLIEAHRTVLLYSQSGAGKRSLLHAGTIPKLERAGFEVLPTAR